MPTREPANPMLEVPTQAEREAAWPHLLQAKGALAETDIVKNFEAEREAARKATDITDHVETIDEQLRPSDKFVHI
ncbi:MAG: hypothetical protein OXE93_08175 [bacterium]|nr:hypothetical protein [bacterium]MCY4257570.1 hypothetical protein [bacterium]